MTTLIQVDNSPGRKAYLHGDGRLLYPAIKAARSPRRYDIARRAIEVPKSFLDHILAALEMQNGGDVKIRRVVA